MTFPRQILVTSALPYANGSIHLGHLVEYIQTDMWVRYQRLMGNECRYMCADDTHGTAIMLSAKKQGITPEALIERVSSEHLADFTAFHILFDDYYTTHSPENQHYAEFIYTQARDKGLIRQAEIEQYYCPRCQMFLPDRFIRGTCPTCQAPDQYGDNCEHCSATYSPTALIAPRCAECGAAPELRKSTHYFFELSRLATELKAWAGSHHIRDEICRKIDEWFDQGLKDWNISRDAPYFGFKIPGALDKYFYVWLDAPIGYIATTHHWCEANAVSVDSIWRSDQWEIHHFIGKDILYFHTLFWPAMLMTAGFSTPTRVNVHGFLTVNGQKMSKSRGTFITARCYLDHLPPEFLRYYYASKLNNTIEDIDLNLDDFVFKTNSDVIGKFVNIASRLGSIVSKKLDGLLSCPDADGTRLLQGIREAIDSILDAYEQLEFSRAIKEVMCLADAINKYIDSKAPWAVVKDDAEAARQICTTGLNGLVILAGLLKPVMPELVRQIELFLGISPLDFTSIRTDLTNHRINAYTHLANRIDRDVVDRMVAEGGGGGGDLNDFICVASIALNALTRSVPLSRLFKSSEGEDVLPSPVRQKGRGAGGEGA